MIFWKISIFHEKTRFFQYKIPICILILMIFPICIFNFKTGFFFHISHIFRFFCEKIKNHILYKTHKTKQFWIKFPIYNCYFENIKKTPFITMIEKNFFFRNFSKIYILKKSKKTLFSSQVLRKCLLFHIDFKKNQQNFLISHYGHAIEFIEILKCFVTVVMTPPPRCLLIKRFSTLIFDISHNPWNLKKKV